MGGIFSFSLIMYSLVFKYSLTTNMMCILHPSILLNVTSTLITTNIVYFPVGHYHTTTI